MEAEEYMEGVQEAKRARRKRAYVIEFVGEGGGWDSLKEAGGEIPCYDDTADALSAMKTLPDGIYRVIAICWQGEKKTEQVTKARIVEI